MRDTVKAWIDLTMREQQINHVVFPIFTGILLLGIILVYTKLIQIPEQVAGIIFFVFCIGLYPVIYILVLVSKQKKEGKENVKILQKQIQQLENIDEPSTKNV